jgi:hypothetical protein
VWKEEVKSNATRRRSDGEPIGARRFYGMRGGGSEILGAFEFSVGARRRERAIFLGPFRFRVRANGRDEARWRAEVVRRDGNFRSGCDIRSIFDLMGVCENVLFFSWMLDSHLSR